MTAELTGHPPVVNEIGIASVNGKAVGDRQKTAQRLLRSTADRSYDGELDIDWDAPIDPNARWMPEHRVSLYGTRLWHKLTEAQRLELGRREAASILAFGIVVEAGLSAVLWRQVADGGVDAFSDHARYALAEVGEESRHSTMFSRAINKAGVRPYVLPRAVMRAVRLMGLIPLGPATIAGTLLVEELLDRAQREAMMDPTVQPHMRQLMKIHVLEEARHITYAREELVRSIASKGKVVNAAHRLLFALATLGVYPAMIDPRVYRSVGINPVRGFWAMVTSPHYRENATFGAEALVRYLHDIDFLRGRVTRRVLLMSRALPPDIIAELKAR